MTSRPSVARAAVAAALVAAVVRLVGFAEVAPGPLHFTHAWAQSDMHTFHRWARDIAAGDVLSQGELRPYHTRHHEMACAANGLVGPRAADCSDRVVRETWSVWVPDHRFWHDPLYAYVLAAVYALGGEPGTVIVAQSVLGIATAVLAALLAGRLFGTGAALVAGLLAAAFGPLVAHESLLLRCSLLSFWGLVVVMVCLRAVDGSSRRGGVGGVGGARAAMAAGWVCGLGVLLKASLLPFVALVPLMVTRDRRLRFAAPYALGLLLAFTPLVWRNVTVGVAPLSLARTGAVNFVRSNAPGADPYNGSTVSPFTGSILARSEGRALPAVQETLAAHRGWADWPTLLGHKALAFWLWYEMPNNANYYYRALHAPWERTLTLEFAWIAILAALGIGPAMRRSRAARLLVLYVAVGVAVCVLFATLSRFRVPVAIAMTPLAGAGAMRLLQAARARDVRALVMCAVVAATAALAVASPWRPVATGARIADFGVHNEIAVQMAARAEHDGDRAGALALVLGQLDTEPAALREIEPGPEPTRVSSHQSGVAGTFVALHEKAAELLAVGERQERAAYHRRRAMVLERLNAPYAAATSR